ncbi:putative RiPP precursor [Palleronia abyssalis]|uniref:Lasso RiPP family leader peptide-containing protein n=1 Tax=Palleronia abyssalis TaxID=1501240 RepID=A0A2R8BZF4_9RHOB|nr:putative RiPP precursor [Palleronia abyssalis]SPJ25538.1 hypothetical protein PAA8504_03389 [Palleronia abyssalis]
MMKTYTAPQLKFEGKLEALTHGQSSGTRIDAAFGAGTLVSELTFS